MTKFAVRNPVTVLVVLVLLIVAGIVSYIKLPRESFPEIKIPYIFVNIIYPGASPENIESLVTDKVENHLEGLDGVKKITSQSTESMASLQIEFHPDVKVEQALQRVKDKIDNARGDLPLDIEEPMVQELNFSNIPIFIVSLSADYPIEQLEKIADNLRDEVNTVRGVLEAKITGKQEREVAIDVDQDKLLRYNLSLYDVIGAIQAQHKNIPGGLLRSAGFKFSVQLAGELKDPKDFAEIIVRSERGQMVRVKDVARVSFTTVRNRSTIARLDGRPSLEMTVTKRTGVNIISIVDEIKKVVEAKQKGWPAGTKVKYTFDQSKEIRHQVGELQNHIISGLLLVVIVVSVFLGFRNSFFISTAIPLSMLLGFTALLNMGITLNMVVLFSLVIALGMLVDDGIVVVENIYRHLHMGKTRMQAAIDGTKEVAAPVTTATVTTIAAFMPILWMPGIMGDFMKYLPITISLTLAGSLFVAFVFNPVFASLFMRKADADGFDESKPDNFEKIRRIYASSLNRAIHHPFLVALGCLVFLIGGIASYVLFGNGTVFFPVSEPQVVQVEIEGPLGIDLTETESALEKIEYAVMHMPADVADIKNVQLVAGKGVSSLIVQLQPESNKGYINVTFKDFEERKVPSWTSMAWLEKNIPSLLPGWKVKVQQMADGPPQGKPVHFELIGDDFNVLSNISKKLMNQLQKMPELTNVSSDYLPASPEVNIKLNREQAMRLGIPVMSASLAVRQAIHGTEATQFREGDDEYKVMVRLDTMYREDLQSLSQMRIFHEGSYVPLGSIAQISQGASLASINHVDGNRTIQVTAEVANARGDQSVPKKKAQAIADSMTLPVGYQILKGSSNREQEESQVFIMQAFFISMALVFLAMVFQFNSVVQPFLVIVGIVVSLGGVFFGLVLSHVTFSIIVTGIGVISLAGVVAKNGIVLIDFINQLRHEGHPLVYSVVEGSKTRIRPVFLTAITAMLGLLPMATGMGFDFSHLEWIAKSETSQFWAPMAWAIFWGLLFNTLLTLFVVPTFYYTWEKLRGQK